MPEAKKCDPRGTFAGGAGALDDTGRRSLSRGASGVLGVNRGGEDGSEGDHLDEHHLSDVWGWVGKTEDRMHTDPNPWFGYIPTDVAIKPRRTLGDSLLRSSDKRKSWSTHGMHPSRHRPFLDVGSRAGHVKPVQFARSNVAGSSHISLSF